MSQEVITLSSPTEGGWARPLSNVGLGMWDQLRNLQAVYPGQAVSWKASADAADSQSIYLYGNALARPEFGGVCTTYSTGPGNLNAISTTNSDTVSAIKIGYMAVMMAPGEVVQRDQWIEPIPSGTYQGCWRGASGPGTAVAQSLQAFDDSDNADGTMPGRMCSAFILPHPADDGLITAVGPSDTLTGVTAETAYEIDGDPLALLIPAHSAKVGSRYRIVFAITETSGASGATLFKAYLDSAAGVPVSASQFYSSISTTPSSGDVVQVCADLYVNALGGSNNVSLSGTATVGAPGTATARSLGIACTMDTAVDNYVTVTCTPNNVADDNILTFISLEKVA